MTERMVSYVGFMISSSQQANFEKFFLFKLVLKKGSFMFDFPDFE